jgi:hypothetical protein
MLEDMIGHDDVKAGISEWENSPIQKVELVALGCLSLIDLINAHN